MIKVRQERDELIISLFQISKLNTLFASTIERQITDLICESSKRIIFDLSRITFIDSAGFQMLLRITRRAQDCGCDFRLCNITDEVEELFNLLELGDKIIVEHRVLSTESLLLEVE